MSLLNRIDAATAGLCPCGADPAPGSAYCGDDCRPTHISRDTDTRMSGELATAMRWRPDLVTEADDADLIPLGSSVEGYTGRYRAQVFERSDRPSTWHLRLDDGHRYVGMDLTDVGGPQDRISVELAGRLRDAWQRLEREMGNTRHLAEEPHPGSFIESVLPVLLAADAHRHIAALTGIPVIIDPDLPEGVDAEIRDTVGGDIVRIHARSRNLRLTGEQTERIRVHYAAMNERAGDLLNSWNELVARTTRHVHTAGCDQRHDERTITYSAPTEATR